MNSKILLLNKLIENGYIANEFPPQFNSLKLANKLKKIIDDWKVAAKIQKKNSLIDFIPVTKSTIFNIPKVGLSRRILSVPNPTHQVILSLLIIQNWDDIQEIFSNSEYSFSKPVVDSRNINAFTTQFSFKEFKRERFIKSFGNYFQLKSDISKFFPSIYTHSISWLIHGKSFIKAKNNRNEIKLLGNKLDKILMKGNSSQTVGIPIGPDTSLIISEIMNCKMDCILQKEFQVQNLNVLYLRFIDDVYIYCDSYAEAELAFKHYQKTLFEYQLDINEEKTEITKAPFIFDTWSIEIGNFQFRKFQKSQATDLERFASLCFKLAKEFPKDSVLFFAIQVLKDLTIYDKNWELYESIILKFLLAESRTIVIASRILCSNYFRVDKGKLETVLQKILKNHITKNHHFEVAWSLTLCKEFKFQISDCLAKQIFESTDYISMVIALDLKSMGLISKDFDLKDLNEKLIPGNLLNECWLFTYESIYQGWLTQNADILKKDRYFNSLYENEVSFYDSNAKIETFEVVTEDEIEKFHDKLFENSNSFSRFTFGGGMGDY